MYSDDGAESAASTVKRLLPLGYNLSAIKESITI